MAIVAVPLSEIDNDTMNAISIATLSSNSENTNVGEQVVAIGNSAGLGQNVTVGYISAKDRSIDVEGTTFSNLFVTDAAISSGNSGGALLNMKGEVIGINFAGNTSLNVENMGYTIPIYTVQDLIDSLMTKETRTEVDASESSYLGIAGVDITSTVSQNYGYPQGILIRQVANNSPAQKAGLTQYDILSSFDGQSVSSMSGFQNILKYYKAGETVTITYYHLENNEYVEKTAASSNDVETATNALIAEGAEAIFVPNDSIIQDGVSKLTEICNEKKIPTYCSSATTVASGCFATLAIDDKGIGKKTVDIAMDYVNGKEVADIPAQVVGIDYCSVNKSAMKTLGISEDNIKTDYKLNVIEN